MKATPQTLQQIERAIKKIASKYPKGQEDLLLTDIQIQVKSESGELLAYNDEDEELTRCVVEQWMDYKEEDFYEQVAQILKHCLQEQKELIEGMSILKPYSFVLVDEDKETLNDLYLVDDETLLLDGKLLEGLDEDLNLFLKQLLAD